MEGQKERERGRLPSEHSVEGGVLLQDPDLMAQANIKGQWPMRLSHPGTPEMLQGHLKFPHQNSH